MEYSATARTGLMPLESTTVAPQATVAMPALSSTGRAGKDIDILYIHPKVRCTLDYVIPMGVPGLVNACPGTKLGRYAFEVKDSEIRRAKIVLMDCHWYPTLISLRQLAARIRQKNPDATIISGGYTATVFAAQITRDFEVDYVIQGDAEAALPILVSLLLAGATTDTLRDQVPNLVGKNGLKTPRRSQLTPDLYGTQNYRDITWFPTMRKYARQLAHTGIATQTYPWIPIFKGCLLKCDFCYGNKDNHEAITGRTSMAVRPAEAVRDDLIYYSGQKDRFWVHIIADFVTMLKPEYRNTVFSQQYDLGLYYEFYNPPKKEHIEQMAKSFKKCFFGLSVVHDHANSPDKVRFVAENRLDEVLQTMKSFPNVQVTLFFDPFTRKSVPDLYKRIRHLRKKYKIYLQKSSLWRMRIPTATLDKDTNEKEFAYFLETAREWKLTTTRFVVWNLWRFLPWLLPLLYKITTAFTVLTLFLNGRLEKNGEWRGRSMWGNKER